LHCTREAGLEKINDSGLFDFFGAPVDRRRYTACTRSLGVNTR
jgi:hypothetical protein